MNRFEIAPGETLTLAPGAAHVMFEGMGGDPLKVGESVPATLVFERAGRIDVEFKVEPLSFAAEAAAPMDHGAMDTGPDTGRPEGRPRGPHPGRAHPPRDRRTRRLIRKQGMRSAFADAGGRPAPCPTLQDPVSRADAGAGGSVARAGDPEEPRWPLAPFGGSARGGLGRRSPLWPVRGAVRPVATRPASRISATRLARAPARSCQRATRAIS